MIVLIDGHVILSGVITVPLVLAATLAIPRFASESIDRRIAEADAVDGLARFVDYPSGADKDRFTLNPKFWAKGVDLSCASPWNSKCGTQRAGTLISKRHIVFAKHFPLWKGVRIVFVGEDGGVCPCTIQATRVVDGSDIAVGLLNAEVTPNIHPAKVLSPDCEKYIGTGEGMPVVTFNQCENLYLTELISMPTNGAAYRLIGSNMSKDARRASFKKKIIVGDSGNPAFMLIGNQAVLLYCLSGRGAGPAIHLYGREVQRIMDELCPGYKLETFDFSKVRCADGK